MQYIGNSIIIDGKIEPATDQTPIGRDNEIYEVLRVENGCPLFLSDHIARWTSSLQSRNIPSPNWLNKLPELIDWLVLCNGNRDCDMRIVSTDDGHTQCGFVETIYPTKERYRLGVDCSLLHAERSCPQSKIFHSQMRQQAHEQQTQQKAYESLLVNTDGFITEGSRSNVFFILPDNTLLTAPDSAVLGGIVRKQILELCNVNNVNVKYSLLHTNELSEVVGAFLSSTPMRILPIRSVSNVTFKAPHPVCQKLMDAMQNKVNAYIADHK